MTHAQTHEIGTFTSVRTVMIVLALTSLVVFAPMAALALGVSSESGISDTSAGVATATSVNTGNNSSDLTTDQHKKRLSSVHSLKSDSSSAVDMDSNLATTPAPLGVNNKSEVGLGVEARMPGASGR